MISRVRILGPGALGLYLGIRCANAGCEVFLKKAGASSDEELPESYALDLHDGSRITWNHPQMDLGKVSADLTIIALKTTVSDQDLKEALASTAPHSCVLTVQNGLGNVERLERMLPGVPVLAGLCQIGVRREGSSSIINFIPGDGLIQLPLYDEKKELVSAISCLLRAAGIRVKEIPSLEEALWRKLMWNIPFNGLTLLRGGMTTEDVLEDPLLRKRSQLLMEETRAAAVAQGIAIEPEYVEQLIQFTERMEPYLPSSIADLAKGRPLELEAIFREPLRRGTMAGVSMPALESLLKELESLKGQS